MRTPTLIVGLGLAGCTTSVGPGPMPAGLNVYEESRLEGLVLQPGRRLGPDEALPLLRPLVEAWASLPPALRPPQVVVHLDPQATPPIDRVEVHRPSGSILVMRRAIPELARGIWLHELAHVLMSGPRPTGSLDSRLIAAVEEGVADYFARVWSGPVERPGFVGGSVGWEALALPALRFDPHPLGERLDRHLADHYGASEPLLLDLIDCFRGEAYVPAADVYLTLGGEFWRVSLSYSYNSLDASSGFPIADAHVFGVQLAFGALAMARPIVPITPLSAKAPASSP